MMLGAVLSGCAPVPKKEVKEPGEVPAEFQVDQPDSDDKYHEFQPLEVKGHVFVPQALDEPELPGANTVPQRSIAEQEKRFAKAKGAGKMTEAQALALILWFTEPKGMDPKETRKTVKAQRKRALQVLTPLGAERGAPEQLIHLAAVIEQAVGDKAKVAEKYDELIRRFPESKKLMVWQGLRDYLDLQAGRPLTYPLPEMEAQTAYELKYVATWSRFRSGDFKGAADMLAQAAAGWTNLWALTWLRRDVLVISTRAGVGPDAAMALVTDLCRRDNADVTKMLRALADAYYLAGEYDSSATVWEKLVEGAAPASVAELRALQALVHFQGFRPANAADTAIAAWQAIENGGDQVAPQVKETVAKRIQDLATRYHSQYASTRDERVLSPAQKLYAAYAKIPDRPNTEQVKEYAAKLEELVVTKPVAAAMLDKETVDVTVKLHREQLVGCYERALQRDPTLSGSVKLVFDVSETGVVTEITPEPAPAPDGLGLGSVAGCMAERVRAWRFPARAPKGITRVSYPFNLSPAQPQD